MHEVPFVERVGWRVSTPKRAELTNLLVAATPSGSHIGFSSLRMEPQFMVLGHSAGTAAAIFATNRTGNNAIAIQDVDPEVLTSALVREGQVSSALASSGLYNIMLVTLPVCVHVCMYEPHGMSCMYVCIMYVTMDAARAGPAPSRPQAALSGGGAEWCTGLIYYSSTQLTSGHTYI
jgi:hypothetical protein